MHDGDQTYLFDDLQYSEDPRFSYEGYVEFRPSYISQVYSDPKPISFRSALSSARINKWDEAKIGLISFQFRQEITGENGFLFSTGSYFGVVINDGHLESVLSPHRISTSYDRFQRLFPGKQVNDGKWYTLAFKLEDDMGTFELIGESEKLSTKIKFPFGYWTEESPIVFGNNLEAVNDGLGSFRGCVKNVVVNNRLIDWSIKGSLLNVEAGCYNYELPSLVEAPSTKNILFEGQGCLKYANTKLNANTETLSFTFRTTGDREVLVDSLGSEFLVHVQGPGITVRNKEGTYSKTIMSRGVSFSDGNPHKFKLSKKGETIEIEVDEVHKASFKLTKRALLSSFYLGCTRDKRVKNSLIQLKDLNGVLRDVVYTDSDTNKVDFLKLLVQENSALLVDGNVRWSSDPVDLKTAEKSSVMLKDPAASVRIENFNFNNGAQLKFMFKTNEPNGLLGFVSPASLSAASETPKNLEVGSFLAVELVDGLVSLVVKLNSESKRLSCGSSKSKLNDNNWHTIEIKRSRLGLPNTESSNVSPAITFICDNSYSRMKLMEQESFPLSMFTAGNVTGNSQVYMPSELWQARSANYLGCLGGLTLNDKEIDMFAQSTSDTKSRLVRGCKTSVTLQCHCLNQGECVTGFERAYCNCDSISYAGSRCEVGASTLSFNGSQGLEYSLIDLNEISSEDIVLRFKTRLRNGFIFGLKKSEHDPSLTLSLENGRVKLVYDRQSNDKVIYVGTPNSFNNNQWQTIHLRRTGQTVRIKLNKLELLDELGNEFKDCSYRFIEIGSIGSQSLVQEYPNFIGWIQNVRFNGDELLGFYKNTRLPNKPGNIDGNAEIGETSLLMHHQLTFTAECPLALSSVPRSDLFNVHLYFKTSQPDGVLFYRQGKDQRFVLLELINGVVRLAFDLGAGLREAESNNAVTDKTWHELTLKLMPSVDKRKLSLRIDEFEELVVDTASANLKLTDIDSYWFGGVGIEQRRGRSKSGGKGFMGCVASLEINNEPINFYSSSISLCASVQRGCIDSVCNPNPCSNNGECRIVSNQVSCDCKMTSYKGPFCRDDSEFYFFGGGKKCGLVKYAIPQDVSMNKESDQLSFGFTTTISDALLTRVESEDGKQYIEIKLKAGNMLIELNINDKDESREYTPPAGKKFNDNRYYVVQFSRNKNQVKFRVDNFEQLEFSLEGNGLGEFESAYVHAGALQQNGNFHYCFYGVMSGMLLNGNSILEVGVKLGEVNITENKYIADKTNTSKFMPLLPDGYCPLGYDKNNYLCIFVGCPLYSALLNDYTCQCYYTYYQVNEVNECKQKPAANLAQPSSKFIPAKTVISETPLGLALGIISGVALAMLAAAIAARKCADGLCVAASGKPKPAPSAAAAVGSMITTTMANNSTEQYDYSKHEQHIPLLTKTERLATSDEYYKDTLDFGYRQAQAPIVQTTETTEIFEQVGGPNGQTLFATMPTIATYNTGSMSHMTQHASHRNLAMDSLFYAQNNSSDYELTNVTCVTMTPNGKYALIGQSNGTPQIWDTISGQLIRSMSGVCFNCSNLTLACNGTLLVGLANDGCVENHTQSLQVWEVKTGKPVLMSHQIKCCVFTLSADTNSIFMAGNQRFGRGISVGILDLVSNELTKEIKSDPTISFGDNPESIVITPDERNAVVACRSSQSGTNFIVFDITKSTEIAQTRSIALDAEPKCIQVLNGTEMLTGTRGGHLIQWNIHTCTPTLTFDDQSYMQAHTSAINQISLSGDNQHLVSASSDGTAKVWNTRTKSLVSILVGHTGEVI